MLCFHLHNSDKYAQMFNPRFVCRTAIFQTFICDEKLFLSSSRSHKHSDGSKTTRNCILRCFAQRRRAILKGKHFSTLAIHRNSFPSLIHAANVKKFSTFLRSTKERCRRKHLIKQLCCLPRACHPRLKLHINRIIRPKTPFATENEYKIEK